MINHFTLTRKALIMTRNWKLSTGNYVRKQKPSIASGNINAAITTEKIWLFLKMLDIKLPHLISSTLRNLFNESENMSMKKHHS